MERSSRKASTFPFSRDFCSCCYSTFVLFTLGMCSAVLSVGPSWRSLETVPPPKVWHGGGCRSLEANFNITLRTYTCYYVDVCVCALFPVFPLLRGVLRAVRKYSCSTTSMAKEDERLRTIDRTVHFLQLIDRGSRGFCLLSSQWQRPSVVCV